MYFYKILIDLYDFSTTGGNTATNTSPSTRSFDIFTSDPKTNALWRHKPQRRRTKQVLAAAHNLTYKLRKTDYRFGKVQLEHYRQEEESSEMKFQKKGPAGIYKPTTESSEYEVGILRLFRENKEIEPPQNGMTDGTDSSSKSSDSRPKVLAVLAVPGYMTPTDFMSFIGGFVDTVEHLRVVRDESVNHYMILLKFREQDNADEFYTYYNGKTFSPLEPERCHVVYISSVECCVTEIPLDQVADKASTLSQESLPNISVQSLFILGDDSGDHVELPTCPVCLERLDSSASGLLTTLCQHTFHCRCLSKWGDGTCPVCRYSQTSPFVDEERFSKTITNLPSSLSQQASTSSASANSPNNVENGNTEPIASSNAPNQCSICCRSDDLWICLICGTIGCGRYASGHAKDHFSDTQHPYSMELESQRVWDYVGDGYVHRLLQNRADGKVVELSAPAHSPTTQQLITGESNSANTKTGHSDRIFSNVPAATSSGETREKLDAVAEEYEILLGSQLESQRLHYEMQIGKSQQESSQLTKRNLELSAMYTKLEESYNSLESSHKEQNARLSENSKKIEEQQKEWEGERKKYEATVAKWVQKSANDARLLLDEKALTKQLLENQQALKTEIADMHTQLADLQEQIRDLTFFISTQQKISENPEIANELEGSSVVSVATPPSNPKSNRKSKRRSKT